MPLEPDNIGQLAMEVIERQMKMIKMQEVSDALNDASAYDDYVTGHVLRIASEAGEYDETLAKLPNMTTEDKTKECVSLAKRIMRRWLK